MWDYKDHCTGPFGYYAEALRAEAFPGVRLATRRNAMTVPQGVLLAPKSNLVIGTLDGTDPT